MSYFSWGKETPLLGLSISLIFTFWIAGQRGSAAHRGPPLPHSIPGAQKWSELYKPRFKVELREKKIVWERKHELWLAREGNLKSEFGTNLRLKYPLLGQLLLYFGPLPLLVHTSPEKQIPGSIREGWPIFKEATTISHSQFLSALELFSIWSFAIQAWPCYIHSQACIDVDVGISQDPGNSEYKWGWTLCCIKGRTQAEVRRPGFQSGLLLQSCEILNLSLYLSEPQIFHL